MSLDVDMLVINRRFEKIAMGNPMQYPINNQKSPLIGSGVKPMDIGRLRGPNMQPQASSLGMTPAINNVNPLPPPPSHRVDSGAQPFNSGVPLSTNMIR